MEQDRLHRRWQAWARLSWLLTELVDDLDLPADDWAQLREIYQKVQHAGSDATWDYVERFGVAPHTVSV